MNEELQNWLGPGPGPQRRLARLSKHGHPLLYFPTRRALALQSLQLYPAQRPAARAARAGLRVWCGLGLARILPATPFTFPTDSPATAFLTRVCPRGEKPPQLAIIAGNPFAPGRRYILLLYERDGHAAAVVKVGLTAHAAALIRQETNALQAIAARTNIAPRVLATHECGNARAVALEHLAGHAPNRATAGDIARVLVPWIDTRRSVHAHEVPAWQRLCEAAPPQSALAAVRARIESLPFHPALYHGDFAPWNVKVQPDGTWRVMDWERGELTGMPCWDWFHHRVQVGLLVERLPTVAHARAIERLLQHREFLRYAESAGVEGMVQEWFLAYLLYSIHIIGPKESLPGKQALLETLAAQWKSA